MSSKSKLSKKSEITLREITQESVCAICDLSVRDDQKKFVASNALSIAQAYFSKRAWFRAIYADDTPIGFVMLAEQPEKSDYFLWRFMIDAHYQGQGFGYCAMQLLIQYVRTKPNTTELLTSVVQGSGSPQVFYEKLGFKLTGEYDEGEALMKFVL